MDVTENLKNVKTKIQDAELRFEREPNSVRLLAVSKTQPADVIRKVYNAGQRCFGENYLQEALEKQDTLSDCDIEWHFIGSIQSNKTKLIAEQFDWVHSVNRFKVAKRLHEQRPADLSPLNICIEVNISHESTKSGVVPESLLSLVEEISALDRLRLRGLMVIPEYQDSFEKQKAIFESVTALQQRIISKGFSLDTLSMGMTHDFEAAIAAGSTIVRLGTAIFGERQG